MHAKRIRDVFLHTDQEKTQTKQKNLSRNGLMFSSTHRLKKEPVMEVARRSKR